MKRKRVAPTRQAAQLAKGLLRSQPRSLPLSLDLGRLRLVPQEEHLAADVFFSFENVAMKNFDSAPSDGYEDFGKRRIAPLQHLARALLLTLPPGSAAAMVCKSGI